MNKTLIIYKERLWESVASDLITFAFLALCIWYSNSLNSDYWTFFTSCLFLLSLSAKITMLGPQTVKIQNKSEALKWANGLQDDEESV